MSYLLLIKIAMTLLAASFGGLLFSSFVEACRHASLAEKSALFLATVGVLTLLLAGVLLGWAVNPT